jgi:hypothetical protein
VHASWMDPNPVFEEALRAFAGEVMGHPDSMPSIHYDSGNLKAGHNDVPAFFIRGTLCLAEEANY